MKYSVNFGVVVATLILLALVGVTALTFRPSRGLDSFRSKTPSTSVISPQAPPDPERVESVEGDAGVPAISPPVATTGALRITTQPAGASFALYPAAADPNGDPPPPPLRDGTAPGSLDGLPPADYVLVFRSEGWPEERATFTLAAGDTRAVDFVFPHGQVEVTSKPDGAQIFHGGRWLGPAPITLDLPVGQQVLIARATNRPERKQTVTIENGGTASVVFEMRPAVRSTRSRPKEEPSVFEKMGRSMKKFFGPKSKK
ncbi:MAG: hypothetical protein ABIR71_11720 [Chthoniobacterales bacterium]